MYITVYTCVYFSISFLHHDIKGTKFRRLHQDALTRDTL
jgi:hypothetical protein